MHARLGCAVAAIAVTLAAAPAASALPAVPKIAVTPLQATPGEALPTGSGTATSLSWAGRVVTGSGITGVTGLVTVPTAGTAAPLGMTALATGIGGYTTSDLIAVGASADDVPLVGGQRYYAWFETSPYGEVRLTGCAHVPTCPVTAGDVVVSALTEVRSDVWHVRVEDHGSTCSGQGLCPALWTFDTDVAFHSSGTSAEWIVAAPTLEQAVPTVVGNVGPVRWGSVRNGFPVTGSNTWTDATGRHDLPDSPRILPGSPPGGPSVAVSIGLGPQPLATSGLVTQRAFEVCTYTTSCA